MSEHSAHLILLPNIWDQGNVSVFIFLVTSNPRYKLKTVSWFYKEKTYTWSGDICFGMDYNNKQFYIKGFSHDTGAMACQVTANFTVCSKASWGESINNRVIPLT